jgi:DNA mismatch endonuclease (patch repair protein)
MKAVRREHTSPEMAVRRVLHAIGLRFRLHRKDLPGTPDIVLPARKTVVFVNGCFWHRHPGCRFASTPKTRKDYWLPKFEANVKRDAANVRKLEEMGWSTLTIWECEAKCLPLLERNLRQYFNLPPANGPIHLSDE